MPDTRGFKLLTLFIVLNVTFQLVCDATAAKIVLLSGFGVSVTVFYFPFTYVISDVVTEVYGYAVARTVLWYTLIASIVAGLFYQLAVAVPAAPFFEHADAYRAVFGIVPRVLIGAWLAIFSGDIANNYVMAKLKVRTEGRYLWLRTITSTVVGQFVNTVVFYVVALGGVIPSRLMVEGILAGWVLKTLVEAAMTPVTYAMVARVKRIEGVDHYDRATNFNPFIISLTNPTSGSLIRRRAR